MEETWRATAAEDFWNQLVRDRARMFMRSRESMRRLRYDNPEAKRMQRLFGDVWREYDTNVYQLIAEAHDENWDAEDEQKHAVADEDKKEAAVNKTNHDDLAGTREESARERLHELQGVVEESLGVMEEEKGRRIRGLLATVGGAEEEARQKKEEEIGRGRREGFYRRAGGT